MNFLQRIFYKQGGQKERGSIFQKILVGYEATISFDTSFLVHFYDAANMPLLLEKKGTHFYHQEYVPLQISTAYFRVHVLNPLRLLGHTVTISIKVRNEIAVEKTFANSGKHNFADWHSVTASLL